MVGNNIPSIKDRVGELSGIQFGEIRNNVG